MRMTSRRSRTGTRRAICMMRDRPSRAAYRDVYNAHSRPVAST
jgi:hypothetical protein